VRLAIVGSEAAKFTPETEAIARLRIRQMCDRWHVTEIDSGDCHLGGIDRWAAEEATVRGIALREFPAAVHRWSGPGGYQERNLLIAHRCTHAVCITLARLPESYTGMRFKLCYHCGTDEHVKSGGCWTVKKARELGKPGRIIVIEEPHEST
jgi:hypothetical protein